MMKIKLNLMRSVLLGVFALLMLLVGGRSVLAAPAPTDSQGNLIPTLPLDTPGLIRVPEGDGKLQGQGTLNQYFQVTPKAPGQKGAVWFAKPISFSKDFNIEMYVYIDDAGKGDGMAVLLKDSANTTSWIGNQGGGSLGIYGPEQPGLTWTGRDYTNGAVLNSFAVEFDNYPNPNGMDYGVIPSSGVTDHIAYTYPGLANQYSMVPWTLNSAIKHSPAQYQKLATGTWKKFTLSYKAKVGTADDKLTYQFEGQSPVTITKFVKSGDSNKEQFASGAAYLGFAGATGGIRGSSSTVTQEMAVAFTKVPNVLNMTLNEQIAVDNNTPFFNSSTDSTIAGINNTATLTNKDSILNYTQTLKIDSDSSLSTIGNGKFTVDIPGDANNLNAPNTVTLDPNSFKINGQSATAVLDKTNNKYVVTSSVPFNSGGTYALTYTGKPNFDTNGNFNGTLNGNVRVQGATYGDLSLSSETPTYKVAANTDLILTEQVTRLYGSHQGVVYDSATGELQPVIIDSQREKLKGTIDVKLADTSSITSIGNAVITIRNNSAVTIDTTAILVNGTPLSSDKITVTADKIVINTGLELKKGGATIDVKYQGTPAGMQVDKTGIVPEDFTTSVTGNQNFGFAQIGGKTTLVFQADPTIKVEGGVALSDLENASAMVVSASKDLPITGKDIDENSTKISYYMKDLGTQVPTEEYVPEKNLTAIGVHQNREALNEGTEQDIVGVAYSKVNLAKLTDGVHYLAIFGIDTEGNVSNVQYLKLAVLADLLTLDRVPNLNFDANTLFNSNQIAGLVNDSDTLDYGLSSFAVTDRIGTFDGDSQKTGQIIVTDARLDQSKPWQLTLSVTDIKSVSSASSLSKQAGIVLQLGIKNQGTYNVLYDKYQNDNVTISDKSNPSQTVQVGKRVVVATGSGQATAAKASQTALNIDNDNTFLRIKKGSQNDFSKKDTFQMQLHWVLSNQ